MFGWRGNLTSTQYLGWMAWFDEEYNEPSRTDHYIMGVHHAVLTKHPDKAVDLDDPSKLRIRFGDQSEQTQQPNDHSKPTLKRLTADDISNIQATELKWRLGQIPQSKPKKKQPGTNGAPLSTKSN